MPLDLSGKATKGMQVRRPANATYTCSCPGKDNDGMNKIGILTYLICFALAFKPLAQSDSTLMKQQVSEVEIIALPVMEYAPLIRTYEIQAIHGEDIGQWLDRNGIAQVNRNGAAGLASSIKFRGLASDHSLFYWNGIPLNSLSLGQCDASLIPGFLFDQIILSEASGANALTQPTLGGAFQLRNKNSAEHIKVGLSYNSMNNTNVHASHSFRWKEWLSTTKVFRQWFENDFSYIDRFTIDRKKIQQSHNNGFNQGITQDIYFNRKKHLVEAHGWLQQRHMLLPSQMGDLQAGTAEQSDAFARLNLGYTFKGIKQRFEFHYGFNRETQKWSDVLPADIVSQYNIQSHIATLQHQWKWTNWLTNQMTVISGNHRVGNSNYDNGVAQYRQLQWGDAVVVDHRKHHAEIAIRQEWREIKVKPAGSIKYQYRSAFGKAILEFQLMTAFKYRAPDMNELYWVPGGNPNLKAEEGWQYSGGLLIKARDSKSPLQWRIRTEAFVHDIQNWIQWRPVNGNIWSPENVQHVISKGGELEVDATFKSNRFTYTLRSMTQYVRATGERKDRETPFQMMYAPRWIQSNSLVAGYGSLGCEIRHRFTSLRYTDESETESLSLPAYHLFSAFLSSTFGSEKELLMVKVGIDNILNTSYESVRSYAMPGRIYQIEIQLLIP